MLDGFFELISGLLNFYYELVPNYAIAIVLLTLTAMLVTTPLTMKSTRSMIEMQRLQPEIKRLQQQYKDDRQKQNEELMKFYKENQINPLGGCLPLLVQMPVFSILFWVVRGLIRDSNFVGLQRELGDYGVSPTVTEGFAPKYLDRGTELYQAMLGDTEMNSFGVDLSVSPAQALQDGFVTALPYLLGVMVIGGLSWFQSKQIAGRNKGAEVTPQQKMMTRIGPVMFVAIAFSMPAALGVYFLVSSTWRVGQQAYITQSLYRGEDSAGAQAQKAVAQARSERENKKSTSSTNGAKKGAVDATSKDSSGGKTAGKAGSGAKAAGNGTSKSSNKNTSSAVSAGSGSKPRQQHPRSKKKKKRK
jgi:YidC/Oxa1 family membrane protein insertase